MANVLRYQKTIFFYDKFDIKKVFSEQEYNRYFSIFQSRITLRDKQTKKDIIIDLVADFLVEFECKNNNKIININNKKNIIELFKTHYYSSQDNNKIAWHGNRLPFDTQLIIKEAGYSFCRLVDKKTRTTKTHYEKNLIDGIYKNLKFTSEEDDDKKYLQIFSGF